MSRGVRIGSSLSPQIHSSVSAPRRLCYATDRVGFEPTKRLPVYALSRRVPSAARPPIRTTRRHRRADAQTRSKYQDPAGFATGATAPKPHSLHRVYFQSADATPEGEERLMNTLPTKKPGDPDVNTIPTWRELAERFRDLVKDFLKEGKELERELEPKLLPALKRFKLEIEKLIAKLEQRTRPPKP